MIFINIFLMILSIFQVSAYPDEEVDHEEDVEGEVYLLGGVLGPGDTLLNSLTELEKIQFLRAIISCDFVVIN